MKRFARFAAIALAMFGLSALVAADNASGVAQAKPLVVQSQSHSLTAPTFLPHVCNILTGSVLLPPSYTLPTIHGVNWLVQINGGALVPEAPGNHAVDNNHNVTVVVLAVRGKHHIAGVWVHIFLVAHCASINPPPTHVPFPVPPPHI